MPHLFDGVEVQKESVTLAICYEPELKSKVKGFSAEAVFLGSKNLLGLYKKYTELS